MGGNTFQSLGDVCVCIDRLGLSNLGVAKVLVDHDAPAHETAVEYIEGFIGRWPRDLFDTMNDDMSL